MKSRQVSNKTNLAAPSTSPQLPLPPQPPQLPQKVSRIRSNSTSLASPPGFTRKRTSSGVFQVDDSEPLAKKNEVSPSQSSAPRPRAETTNGRKNSDTADTEKRDIVKKKDVPEKKKEKINENVDNKTDKVIEKFDSKAKSNCVSAFKESDSWD